MNRLSSCSKPSYKAVAVILLTAMVFMLLFGFLSPVFALEYEPEQSHSNYDVDRTSISRFIYNAGLDSGNKDFVSQVVFSEFYPGDPSPGTCIFSDYIRDDLYILDTSLNNYVIPRNLDSYFLSQVYDRNSIYFPYPSEDPSLSYDVVSAPVITLLFNLNGTFDFISFSNGGSLIGYVTLFFNNNLYYPIYFRFEVIGYGTKSGVSVVRNLSDFARISMHYGFFCRGQSLFDDSFDIDLYDTNQYLVSFTFPPDLLRVPNANFNVKFESRMLCSSYLYSTVPMFKSYNDVGADNPERSSISFLVDYAASSLNFAMIDSITPSVSYDQGYSDGYNYGNQHGFNSGYENGYNDGSASGYTDGYNDGLAVGEGNIDSTISNFVPSILGGVADFIIKVLDFEVFGISVLKVLGTVGVLLILVAFIKMIT